MESTLNIAIYISRRYHKEFQEPIEEMKLHKLLYLAQRESLIHLDEPMFPEQFEAWEYGPVMVAVRTFIHDLGTLPPLEGYILPEKYQPVMDSVFENYAHKEAWSLSRISRGEYSYQKARESLGQYEDCHNLIKTEDIRRDADRIIIRRHLLKLKQPQTQKRESQKEN